MMSSDTLEQLERSLPNGFHDAQIRRISLDYSRRTIVFDMSLWVGDIESTDKAEREAYQFGILTVSEFDFCVIVPPDLQYPYQARKALTVSSGPGNPQHVPFLDDIPADAFAHWFFVREWNSFIYFVARVASFELTDPVGK